MGPKYMPLTEAWEKRLREAREKGEEPVEVNCFGTEKYEIINVEKVTIVKIKLWHEKSKRWEFYEAREYIDVCPACGRLMKVRYIPGTTYIATCSKQCTKEYLEYLRSKRRGVS